MRGLIAVAFLTAGAAQAETPKVMTDIAPVHSLVAQVMGDLGTPQLLINPATDDAHHMQMRPSQARQLANSDLVIWMGEAMTPWLQRVIANLGDDSVSLELLELSDMPLLLEGADDIPQTLADSDEKEMQHGHDDHDEEHGDEHGHGHGGVDSHAWLDPLNAQRFLEAIAAALAHADPENATTYHANADAAKERLKALYAELDAQLTPFQQATLIPYHDAYRYFFTRFGLQIAGSLLDSDGSSPSAARLAWIRDVLDNEPGACVFFESGGNEQLITAVTRDTQTQLLVLDPIGALLTPGPELHENLLRNLADTIAGCPSGS